MSSSAYACLACPRQAVISNFGTVEGMLAAHRGPVAALIPPILQFMASRIEDTPLASIAKLVIAESRAFPEIGFYREEDELMDHSSNELLLRQIAQSTGGQFNPAVKDVFEARGRSVPSSLELWPGFLALAIVLNLAEIFLRKWRGLMENFRPAESVSPARL